MKKTGLLIGVLLSFIIVASILLKKPAPKVDYVKIRKCYDSICNVYDTSMVIEQQFVLIKMLNRLDDKLDDNSTLRDSIKFTTESIKNVYIKIKIEREEAERRNLATVKQQLITEDKLQYRKSYDEILRNIFLDNSFDIKVAVEGKKFKTLKLSYVLFSDVWDHNFKKNGYYDTWKELGFTRIVLDDGYGGYNKQINL